MKCTDVLLRYGSLCRYSRGPRQFGSVESVRLDKRCWGASMGKELPIFSTSAPSAASEQAEKVIYSRVFCQRDNSPPLRLLVEFLKVHGQAPVIPSGIDESVLDEWAWVQMALSYHPDRKPIQLFCLRDRGTYKDVFDQEKGQFSELISVHDGIESQLVGGYLTDCRFILTTRMIEQDMTDEGYDFNGWILEFYQEQCNGIVQIDNRGFFSPKGELIVDMSVAVED